MSEVDAIPPESPVRDDESNEQFENADATEEVVEEGYRTVNVEEKQQPEETVEEEEKSQHAEAEKTAETVLEEDKTEDQVPDITGTEALDAMTTSLDGIEELPVNDDSQNVETSEQEQTEAPEDEPVAKEIEESAPVETTVLAEDESGQETAEEPVIEEQKEEVEVAEIEPEIDSQPVDKPETEELQLESEQVIEEPGKAEVVEETEAPVEQQEEEKAFEEPIVDDVPPEEPVATEPEVTAQPEEAPKVETEEKPEDILPPTPNEKVELPPLTPKEKVELPPLTPLEKVEVPPPTPKETEIPSVPSTPRKISKTEGRKLSRKTSKAESFDTEPSSTPKSLKSETSVDLPDTEVSSTPKATKKLSRAESIKEEEKFVDVASPTAKNAPAEIITEESKASPSVPKEEPEPEPVVETAPEKVLENALESTEPVESPEPQPEEEVVEEKKEVTFEESLPKKDIAEVQEPVVEEAQSVPAEQTPVKDEEPPKHEERYISEKKVSIADQIEPSSRRQQSPSPPRRMKERSPPKAKSDRTSARDYSYYEKNTHKTEPPPRLPSYTSFSSYLPLEKTSYTPISAFTRTQTYTPISSYSTPSTYLTRFDDIVKTGAFASNLYSTSRLMERSRSRTRERRNAMRSQRSASNYNRYTSTYATAPFRTRDYSTPPSSAISRIPSRSGSFAAFMDYSGAKQYELARSRSRSASASNSSINNLWTRSKTDLFYGAGRLSRVDSYVRDMDRHYESQVPSSYATYRSTSRSYMPTMRSYYTGYQTRTIETPARIAAYSYDTQPKWRSVYENRVIDLERSLSHERLVNTRMEQKYRELSNRLESANRQIDLYRTTPYTTLQAGLTRYSIYTNYYPFY